MQRPRLEESDLSWWNYRYIREMCLTAKRQTPPVNYVDIEEKYVKQIPQLLVRMNSFYRELKPSEVIIVRLEYTQEVDEDLGKQFNPVRSYELVVVPNRRPVEEESEIENIGQVGYYIVEQAKIIYHHMKFMLVDNNEVKANQNRKGSFFTLSTKVNTKVINLKQLQIYNYDEKDMKKVLKNKKAVSKHDISLHCLIYTLKFQKCPQEIYQALQDKIIHQKGNEAGDQISLTTVTDLLGNYGGDYSYAIQYKLKTNESYQYKYKFIRCDSLESANYRICYSNDHYFPWITFPISRFYLEKCKWHYINDYVGVDSGENNGLIEYLKKIEKKGKDLQQLTKCPQVKRGEQLMWKSEFGERQISSMELVDFLLEEPQAFREISATELDNTRFSAVVRKGNVDLATVTEGCFKPITFVDKTFKSFVGPRYQKDKTRKVTYPVTDWLNKTTKFEKNLAVLKDKEKKTEYFTGEVNKVIAKVSSVRDKIPVKSATSLRIISLNVRGLENRLSHSIRREVLSHLFTHLIHADIIIMEETKTVDSYEWYMFPEWHIVPSSNKDATNGVVVLVRPGLAPYIKKVDICDEEEVKGNLVAIDCCFPGEGNDVRVIGMYYPTQIPSLKQRIIEKLDQLVKEASNKVVIAMDGNEFMKRESKKERENYERIITNNNLLNIFDGKPTFTAPDGSHSSLDAIVAGGNVPYENAKIFTVGEIWSYLHLDHALLMVDVVNPCEIVDLEGPLHIDNAVDNVTKYWPIDEAHAAHIVALDFETSTQGKHVPYQLGYSVSTATGRIIKSGCVSGYEGHSQLIPQVMRELPPIFIGYFHNLTYDVSFLLRHIEIKSITRRAGSFYAVDGVYKEMDKEDPEKIACFRRFRIYDSYKFMGYKLSDLPGMLFKAKDRLSEKEYERYQEIVNDKTISNTTRIQKLKKFLDEESTLAKEKLFYRWYTKENIINCLEGKFPTLGEIKKFLKGEEDYGKVADDYLKALKRWKQTIDLADDDQKINLLDYSAYYCQRDCEVLLKCIHAFNTFCVETFGLSMFNYVSISSMGDALALKRGCYDGVVAMSGAIRAFIQKAVYGGRVMLADNKKQSFLPDMEKLKPYLDPNDKGGEPLPDELAVDDMDAVGLYTSTMALMGGIPKGVAKVFTPAEVAALQEQPDQYDDYYVEVEVLDPGKRGLPFPLLPHRREDGGVDYNLGQVPHEPYTLVLNKLTILDAIQFQGVKFRFIRGVYFNEGVNMGISYLADELTNLRNSLKREGNPMQTVVKLLCNSLYGKTIMKESDTKTVILRDEESFLKYVVRHANEIVTVDSDEDDKNFRVLTVRETISDHWTRPQAGARILAYSKRIMCRLFHIAHENNLKIFYQDTDSLQGPRRDIRLLAKAMEEAIANGSLTKLTLPPRDSPLHPGLTVSAFEGKGIGNFHSDFEVAGVVPAKGVPIVGVGAIYVGKKSYCVMLRSVHAGDDGKPIVKISYHCRLKGIPKRSIDKYCEEKRITPFELYQQLAAGEKVQFDLADANNPVFRKTATLGQTSRYKFNRVVSF